MIKAILTDIEGTTSSISFVRDVLFPYAAEHLPMFVRAKAKTPEVAAQLQLVAQEAGVAADDYSAIISALQRWIAEDKKITPLKALQGMLWEHGYRHHDYRAHVYPDAHQQIKIWHADGVPLYVYSSGSIQAQKLFFGYSEFGDMTPFFSGYFDTTSGAKQEVESYRRIASVMALPVGEILFLSDIVGELNAAKQAGLQTCWLVRSADVSASAEDIASSLHPVAHSFSEILVK